MQVDDAHHKQQTEKLRAMRHEINDCLSILRGGEEHWDAKPEQAAAALEASLRLFALLSDGHVDAETAELNRKAVFAETLQCLYSHLHALVGNFL